ncbi:MAG: hypothetical protein JNN15_11510 [Blastocatellia bacterium]|nr:hypothetical protein [Blastocatellia bacterium]
MELSVGAKCRVPYKGELVVATIIDISVVTFPNGEKGWAVDLIADPPCDPVSLGFPVRGDIKTVTVEMVEQVFERQLQMGVRKKGAQNNAKFTESDQPNIEQNQ